MAAVPGVSLSTPKVFSKATESPKPDMVKFTIVPYSTISTTKFRRMYVRPVAAVPDSISGKVEESIKNAQETCSDDPVSGECAAAWDEVEELSAAASHARDRKKEADALEEFCKDNPETDECRTYDN
ncbi:calvin cycle protein CP12-2, chloroplastic-like [Henckelia pumila]|uniref:calvin cycle protein CP12-2, chloroplastic-like n=1 Tax=Henckelia pumila TaxID=405737 RepID=UPI003C6E6F6C